LGRQLKLSTNPAKHQPQLLVSGGALVRERGQKGIPKFQTTMLFSFYLSSQEIKKEMKKDPLSSKAPEKPLHEVSSGNALLSSETILRTNKRGERRRRRCQVAFSYLPQNDDELELKVGDIIEVVGEVEEGWWEGVLNGKTGMFPSNFIKELSGESDDLGISQDEQLSKSRPEALLPPASLLPFPAHGAKGKTTFEGTILYRAAPGKTEGHRRYYSLRETTGSESDGGDSSSTKSEGTNGTVATAAIQPKKVKGVGFGDIFKDKPIKLRPRSIEVENDFLPVEKTIGKKLPPTTATPDSSKTEMDSRTKSKDYCKVIFPYEAQNDDELTIKEGDIVTLINKDCIDVGWWEGELNGRRGVFPDNFVKLLPPDFEKEGNRPKKPPPPSAPVIKQGAGTTERKHEIKKIPPERPETLPNRTEEKERPEREPKLDLQKPSVPAIPPKKPRPPKTNSLSRPGALPPRRPERPVGPMTHTRYCSALDAGGLECSHHFSPCSCAWAEVGARLGGTAWVSGLAGEGQVPNIQVLLTHRDFSCALLEQGQLPFRLEIQVACPPSSPGCPAGLRYARLNGSSIP
uniref:SH3 domain containing kinase binding protein 1 n=1 Tax=Equus asinus asinus TaxID=83772 RepID=A0A8C4MEP6_EQUAS